MSPSFDPDEILAADPFDYSTTMTVSVNPLTANVAYSVFLSTDGVLDTNDRRVATGVVAVDGLGSYPIEGSADLATLSPPMSPGIYDVIVQVDPDDQILEPNETNNDNDSFGSLVIQGANIQPTLVECAAQAFVGQSYDLQVTFRNDGQAAAPSFAYDYVLTRDGRLSSGIRIGGGTVPSLGPESTVVVTDQVVLSETLTPGSVEIAVVADPDGRVDEINELDNERLRSGVVQLRGAVPNLTAEIVEASTVAASGEAVAVTVALRNLGFVGAEFDYDYVLVPAVGPDVVIGRRRATVAARDRVRRVETVPVPAAVSSGTYRLGVVVDPDEAIEEVTEADNRYVGPSVDVVVADLAVATEELPEARVGLPYGTVLRAVGGAATPTWRVAQGSLPTGYQLATDGRLSGTTDREGLFEFTVEVTSAGRTAQRPLRLSVREADVALAVVESTLPNALLGRPYEASVIAVGGQPPLTWVASGLPDGLTLDASGILRGTPAVQGLFEVIVAAVDGLGANATGTLLLRVLDPALGVRVSTTPLPTAVVGEAYCATGPVSLRADGGTPPLRWLATDLPGGLALDADGRLCGTPDRTGRYWAVVTVIDAEGQIDTASLVIDVVSGDSVLIRTVSLPAAVQANPYQASLEAAGGTPPYVWSAEWGTLPPGVELGADGRLTGQSDSLGIYAFAVQVTDARGVIARRALSIEIKAAEIDASDDGGCACVAASHEGSTSMSWALFIVGIVAWSLRRERGRRG